MQRRGNGGEDDGPSRALAKAIDGIADKLSGLDVFVDRPDRFGRGGDHEPFLKLGYPAVRFSVANEDWDAQHQDLRKEGTIAYGDTIDRMDFPIWRRSPRSTSRRWPASPPRRPRPKR